MTKIRLIRNDGAVLVVDVTDYSLNITRSVPVLPVPVLGERYAIDLNMVTTDFKLNVILSDDDCAASSFTKTAAKASIDFSALANADGGTRQSYMSVVVRMYLSMTYTICSLKLNLLTQGRTQFALLSVSSSTKTRHRIAHQTHRRKCLLAFKVSPQTMV